MDAATPLGMALALVALVVSIFMEGGSLAQLWNPSALILVLGGTVGFTLTTFRTKDFSMLPKAVARAFSAAREDRAAMAEEIVGVADTARKQGLLELQNRLAQFSDPLLRRGLSLVIDGMDPQAVREVLDQEVAIQRRRLESMAAVLEQAGGYAPTVGIIGTVMGLVHVLSNLGDTERLGPAIAAAFMATFYGIFTANFFWLPLGTKLRGQAERFEENARMIILGVTAIHTGDTPSRLREKLETYLRDESGRAQQSTWAPAPAAPGEMDMATDHPQRD
ncbi:MAG: MotA/TolQ/ExbB proton channel family protein [Limnochordaceae bacterium]|nr:MotA/TolQ/ExbB proton channel family protein [Limnochordaceae bacterium]